MNIAIILVHNKGDEGNQQQIIDTLALLDVVNETQEIEEINGTKKTISISHYRLKGTSHRAKIYQIIPFGVMAPSNKNSIDSHNVYYGKGDEDKTGNHPRFLNWGLKRGVDYGGKVVINLKDPKKFNSARIKGHISKLNRSSDKTEFIDDEVGQLMSSRVIREVGQFNEKHPSPIDELKSRIDKRGFKHEDVNG